MLNILWPIFIITSFIFALLTNNMNELSSSIFNSASSAVEMTITFFASVCMWNGIMKIVQETSIINKLTCIIKPVMKILFPKMAKESNEYKEITINIIANLFGIGNAATPLGLKAMESMQEKNENKNKLSNDMCMFIVLNTASIQIIPSTVIAIRTALGSESPSVVIFPIWCATIAADLIGIIATKIILRKY